MRKHFEALALDPAPSSSALRTCAVIITFVVTLNGVPCFKPLNAEAASTVPPVQTATADREVLLAEAHAFGHNGYWSEAHERLQKVITSGEPSEWEWNWATAAALAAGETNISENYCRQALDRFEKSDSPAIAERCAKQCLSLPGVAGDLLERAVKRADFALAMDPYNPWRLLVKGMAEYRQGHWRETLQALKRCEESRYIEIAVLAWPVGAMARHQLGDASGAAKAIEQASRRLRVMANVGYLGSTRSNTWDNGARAAALLSEAERLVLGRQVFPPLRTLDIAAGRRRWQEVAGLISAAERHASQAQWAEASAAYQKALKAPGFTWDLAEFRQELLAQNMAMAFLMAGELARHREICEALAKRAPEDMLTVTHERYGTVFLCGTAHLPPELVRHGITLGRLACPDPEQQNNNWLLLVRGMADYRDGRYEQARAVLLRAEFRGDAVSQARILAFQAMACQQLGRTGEAQHLAREAQSNLELGIKRGATWKDIAFAQLAIKELLGLLRAPVDSGKK